MVDARIGDNRRHRHLAVQLSLGLDGPVTVEGAAATVTAQCVIIAAHAMHSLGPNSSRVRSLYIEPHGMLARTLDKRATASGGLVAADELHADMAGDHPAMLAALRGDPPVTDPRVRDQLGMPATGQRLSKSQLRALSQAALGASPARLRQWHRLQAAVRALSAGAPLADAALLAGFADQAHFTRLLVRWFGITPGRGLKDMAITIAD